MSNHFILTVLWSQSNVTNWSCQIDRYENGQKKKKKTATKKNLGTKENLESHNKAMLEKGNYTECIWDKMPYVTHTPMPACFLYLTINVLITTEEGDIIS